MSSNPLFAGCPGSNSISMKSWEMSVSYIKVFAKGCSAKELSNKSQGCSFLGKSFVRTLKEAGG
jgi:hypothetical protein